MHILISPNAFKEGLTATDAALAIEKGLLQSNLACTLECFPIGDGGDGTMDLLINKYEGTLVNTLAHDVLGRKIHSYFGLIDNGKTAVIEMANASGIHLLQPTELKPLSATSFGTGEQLKLALDQEVNKIILGMGGSATIDGGVGILKALGARFLDEEGGELLILPEDLVDLDRIDLSRLDERALNCEIIILCDVDNILLGDQGAAKVFGPQKGASVDDVEKLNNALLKFTKVTLEMTGIDISKLKHGGTAGGAAAGLNAFLSAKLVKGIEFFLELTDFKSSLERSDLIITGEGSIDEQTLQGKAPLGVALQAKLKGLPVIALAGKVPLIPSVDLQKHFDILIPISDRPRELGSALKLTTENLIRTSVTLGNLLALKLHI
jgi:glycerate kinase